MFIGMIICAILAAGGIGFGVWTVVEGETQKDNLNKQISTLKAQNSELIGQIVELESDKTDDANELAKEADARTAARSAYEGVLYDDDEDGPMIYGTLSELKQA